MMIHLTNTLTSLIKKLKAEGFNGVRFEELYIEKQLLTDHLLDGGDEKSWKKRQRDYVAFIAQPNFETDFVSFRNGYAEVQVNDRLFLEDFREFLQKELGSDVNIRYSAGCFEYECAQAK